MIMDKGEICFTRKQRVGKQTDGGQDEALPSLTTNHQCTGSTWVVVRVTYEYSKMPDCCWSPSD